MASKILLCIVAWVRGLASFSGLEACDQSKLLEACCHRLVILGSVQWCPAFIHAALNSLANQLLQGGETSAEISVALETIKSTFNILVDLDIDATEHACLKAIAIFNPEPSSPLKDPGRVKTVREQIISSLRDHVTINNHQSEHRLKQLLQVSKGLETLQAKTLDLLFTRPDANSKTTNPCRSDFCSAILKKTIERLN